MHNGDSITFLRGAGSPIKSPILGQVAAVLASGIQFSSAKPLLDTVEEVEGKLTREHVWTFDGESQATFRPHFAEETLPMSEVVRRFNDLEWCRVNADHPIAYMRAILENRSELVARVKVMKPLEKLTRYRGGDRSVCLIPQDATEEERAKMLAEFEKGIGN